MNYKTDDSFFTVILPIRTPLKYWDIYKWAETDTNAVFRFIRDYEIEQDRLTLKDVNEMYPGVKVVGAVTNPWARALWAYNVTIDPPEGYPGVAEVSKYFKNIDFTSFDAYLNSMEQCELLDTKTHPSTTQSTWLSYDDRQVDYILRTEHLNKDFKCIQQYFETDVSLGVDDFTIDYKQHYTSTTKNIIEKYFKEDIDRFGYEF